MTLKIQDNIFRQYDIRGLYGTELSDEFAEALGRGYAAFLRSHTTATEQKKLKVSIGMDARTSSEPLKAALIKGLIESGIDCVDIGYCPTPLQYFSLHAFDLDGGLMITGSHNPSEYNGFKISVGKGTIHGDEIQELKDVIKETLKSSIAMATAKGEIEKIDIIKEYTEYHVERFAQTIPQK
ncbi:MAG: phosphomannomutase, partial [Deltaproteobacteria bacterium]|nr:phosphomannomutase [Deltaproteobacteria bacterium]